MVKLSALHCGMQYPMQYALLNTTNFGKYSKQFSYSTHKMCIPLTVYTIIQKFGIGEETNTFIQTHSIGQM